MNDTGRVTIRTLGPPTDWHAELERDIRDGLGSRPYWISSKYFYDERGSALFDEITRLPEYYLTRTETSILEQCAAEILARTQPDELLELGSGYSRKTRLLIEALHTEAPGSHYVPIDISGPAIEDAVDRLSTDHPWLDIDGVIGDFFDLHLLERRGRRLISFLGSTIGNLTEDNRRAFLESIGASMTRNDAFLVGLDLVKSLDVLVPAYNDSHGVTAEFNRNILRVLNRDLNADFPADSYQHDARWNPDKLCIEMWLRSSSSHTVMIEDLALEVQLDEGEEIHTEYSCKFTRERAAADLGEVGLEITGWYTDPSNWFALALAEPRPDARSSR